MMIRQIPWTEQPQEAVGASPEFPGLCWLWGMPQGSGPGSLRNVVNGSTAALVDSNNVFLHQPTRHGVAGRNSAGSNESSLGYSQATSSLSGLTELTLFAWFIFDSAATNAQWLNFRTDLQHSIDVFSKTGSSINWGSDWAGAWNGASQQTLSGLVDGEMVCIGASITQSGARLWHQGRLSGTKSGSGFTTSSSSVQIAAGTRMRLLGSAAARRAFSDGEMQAVTANPWQLFAPRVQRIPATATISSAQLIRPSSDISSGAWTPSTGVDLYAMLDEATSSDTDFITTTTASTAEVQLTTASDPAVSTGHIVRYRAKGTGTLTVKLMQGATTIATHVPTLTTSYQTFTFTLSGAEADSITDYSNLRLQFVSS